MNEIQIEKGVPIPSRLSDVLKKMSVGDSIVVAPIRRASVTSIAKFIGIKLVTRKLSETELRVWRSA
jgi:hypothetical protein